MRRGQSLIVMLAALGLSLVAACGGSSPQPAPAASSPAAKPATAPSGAATPAALTGACALISLADIQAALGPLKPDTAPTLQTGPPGGPPGMLDGAVCSYRFPNGDLGVLLAHFKDGASASNAIGALLSTIPNQGGSAPTSPGPLSGFGDEALIYAQPLPPPVSGNGVTLLVRKGAVAFILTGGFAQGSGPADLAQTYKTLAAKVLATL